jgi:hypothetical protein
MKPAPTTCSVFGEHWDVEILDVPAKGKNQDAWHIGRDSVVVVDGATPLGEDWPQDVGDFARRIAPTLTKFADDSNLETEEVWHKAIEEIGQLFSPEGFRRSAGAILLRKVENKLEFSALGDLYAMARSNSEFHFFHNNQIVELDQAAKKKGGLSSLIENRMKLNTVEGYWIFGDNPTAATHITRDAFPSEGCSEIFLSSDGYFRNRFEDPQEILNEARAVGLEMPEFDPNGLLLDAPDDVTAIYLKRQEK